MDYMILLIALIFIEIIIWCIFKKLGYWNTYKGVVRAIIDSIKDGELTEEEIEKIRKAIDDVQR